ncbi:cysteine tRS [Acrasis kona]|uniref:Cysteine tRS n=1 Tax=Acrasis kona TaxID=1008807 RepID=A0AAW2ZG43_9EUKA
MSTGREIRAKEKSEIKRIYKASKSEKPITANTKFEDWYEETSKKHSELKNLDKTNTVQFYFDKKVRRLNNPNAYETKKKLKDAGIKVNVETTYEQFYQAASQAIKDISNLKAEDIQAYFDKQVRRAKKALNISEEKK